MNDENYAGRAEQKGARTATEVFIAFLRLGAVSFGGPIAHIGYFRREFVERRGWLDERTFADLIGLCQFLPGPASSKLGFSLGLLRAGYAGGLAAWLAFTAPSALLMFAFANGAEFLSASATGLSLLHGLQILAVGIVAQAVWRMAATLCPDVSRRMIALLALLLAFAAPASLAQIAPILLGVVLGFLLCRAERQMVPEAVPVPVGRTVGIASAIIFALLLGFSFAPLEQSGPAVFAAFYRSGALVFGGGHVVLPLLYQSIVMPGWVSDHDFLSGYGAAQIMPGPLFTFATYLGAMTRSFGGAAGALLATVAIFLPGLLLQLSSLPYWDFLRRHPAGQAGMRGVNAAVVGLLGAALYNPVWTNAIHRPIDVVLAVAAFLALTFGRFPILAVAAILSAASVAFAVL